LALFIILLLLLLLLLFLFLLQDYLSQMEDLKKYTKFIFKYTHPSKYIGKRVGHDGVNHGAIVNLF
jgi:hypothetical protein